MKVVKNIWAVIRSILELIVVYFLLTYTFDRDIQILMSALVLFYYSFQSFGMRLLLEHKNHQIALGHDIVKIKDELGIDTELTEEHKENLNEAQKNVGGFSIWLRIVVCFLAFAAALLNIITL